MDNHVYIINVLISLLKSLLPNQLENSSENLKPIDSELSFDTISNETSDFSNPVLYNNCANPITLSYIIENVKTDYTISDTSIPITYNGSLLKDVPFLFLI